MACHMMRRVRLSAPSKVTLYDKVSVSWPIFVVSPAGQEATQPQILRQTFEASLPQRYLFNRWWENGSQKFPTRKAVASGTPLSQRLEL